MGIITIISILLPYAIIFFRMIQLTRQNSKLRTEFFKKLSDSETERDNIINEFKKAVNENFEIGNENSKKQDKNWKNAKKKFDELDETNEENLEIFQEFDYIIQELDKKVNEVSDEQEEILMRKELDTQQINIVCRELDKLTLKRDRYENRLTEICKAFDELNLKFNQNTQITVRNFEKTNDQFGRIQRNFDKIKGFPKKLKELDELNKKINNQDIEIDGLTVNLTRIYRELNDKFRDEIRKPHIDTEALAKNTDNLSKKVAEIDRTLNKVIQRQLQAKNLKEVLENPIEVTRPSCETKLKMKEQVNQYDVESVTEIVNKVEFEWLGHTFEKGCVFIWKNGSLEAKLRALTRNFREEFAKSLWAKVLELNEPKPKRKYTKIK